MLYAVCICILFGSTLHNVWLTDTDRDGRVCWRCVPSATKQRWTVRPPLLCEKSTFPFPLVAEAALCMSLS